VNAGDGRVFEFCLNNPQETSEEICPEYYRCGGDIPRCDGDEDCPGLVITVIGMGNAVKGSSVLVLKILSFRSTNLKVTFHWIKWTLVVLVGKSPSVKVSDFCCLPSFYVVGVHRDR